MKTIEIDGIKVDVESCYDCPVYKTTGSDCDVYICDHPTTKNTEFPDFCPLKTKE